MILYVGCREKRQQASTDVDGGSLKIEQKEIRRNNSYFESFCQNLLSIYVLKKQSLNDKQQQTLNKAKFVRAVESKDSALNN